MSLQTGDRVESLVTFCRGYIVGPSPGVPNQWEVQLDHAPGTCDYMAYWLRKLSLLELIAEAAQ